MNKYEVEITGILDSVQPAINKCNEQIEAAREAMDKARKAIGAAVIAGNSGEYLDEQINFDNAAKTIEMLTARRDDLRHKPLISEEKYNDMVAGILDEMEAKNEADKREAAELCDRLEEIAERNLTMMEEGNDLLHRLQYDVYRAADCLKDKDGNVLGYGAQNKRFKDRNSLQFWAIHALRNCGQYKAWRESIGLDS